MARVSCLRLLVHWARRAASRALWTAGRSRPIRTAMIAMTTSSSIRVKPRAAARGFEDRVMTGASEMLGMGRDDVGIVTGTGSVHRPTPAGSRLAGVLGAGRRALDLRGVDALSHLLDGVGRATVGDRRE